MFFMILPASLVTLNFIFSNRWRNIIIGIILILLLVPPYLPDILKINKIEKINDSPEFKVSMFLEINTNKDDVVISAPSAIYVALSERKNLMCEPYMQTSMLFNITDRYRDLISFYVTPSQSVAEKYNVSYVVFGDREMQFMKYVELPEVFNFSSSTAFEKVYDDGNYKVFYIKDVSKLDATYDESLIHSKLMKKIHYRLWFDSIENIIMYKLKSRQISI